MKSHAHRTRSCHRIAAGPHPHRRSRRHARPGHAFCRRSPTLRRGKIRSPKRSRSQHGYVGAVAAVVSANFQTEQSITRAEALISERNGSEVEGPALFGGLDDRFASNSLPKPRRCILPPVTLSVVIITHNEEANLVRTLEKREAAGQRRQRRNHRSRLRIERPHSGDSEVVRREGFCRGHGKATRRRRIRRSTRRTGDYILSSRRRRAS
jgi:hypothetical protein